MVDKLVEQTTIRLPSDLKKKIQKQADEMGESFNGMVLILINKSMEYINHHLL